MNVKSINNGIGRVVVCMVLLFFAASFAGMAGDVPTPVENPVEIATEDNSTPAEPQKEKTTLLGLILAGGIIGHVIIFLSVVSVAFMIEHLITIRLNVLIPPGLADDVVKNLSTGKWNEAAQQCRNDPSFLGSILTAGLSDCELGWESVEKAVEDATAEHAARLYRKTEYLNVIGNIAPMLGLLGTVVGMVIAFRDLADSGGFAKGGELAEGIYLALVTTVEGLIVAIPSITAYSIFNNRIALYVAEATYVADQVLRPVKKVLVAKKK